VARRGWYGAVSQFASLQKRRQWSLRIAELSAYLSDLVTFLFQEARR
jgi:hypothetical protein